MTAAGAAAAGRAAAERLATDGLAAEGLAAADGPAHAAYRAYGATWAQAVRLAAHDAGGLATGDPATDAAAVPAPDTLRLPLADEPGVGAWRVVVADAAANGAAAALRRHLVELRFPVHDAVRASPAYVAATRLGRVPATEGDGEGEGAPLAAPDRLGVALHATAAGCVPVVRAARADFVTLVRAILHRNAPVPVPASMGACIVGGYLPAAARGRPAARAFGGAAETPRERFVLLSDGPYAGVPAAALGLDDDAWRAASVRLRLEHECAHYVARRATERRLRDALSDELAADYAGLVAARGAFDASWLLRCLGLNAQGVLLPGGRLANYRGDPPLDDAEVAVLGRVAAAAARGLAAFDPCDPANAPRGLAPAALAAWVRGPLGLAGLGLAVLHVGALGLAAPGGAARLRATWARYVARHLSPLPPSRGAPAAPT